MKKIGIVLLGAILGVAFDTCYADDQASVVLKRAALLPQRLTSYKLTETTQRFVGSEAGAGREPEISSMVLVRSGRMFRCEVEFPDANTGARLRRKSAFNGERHQYLEEAEKQLVLSNASRFPNPTLRMDPWILPYAFLLEQGHELAWSTVRDAAIWEKKGRNCRYLGKERLRNHECEVVEMPATGTLFPEAQWKIFFATDVHYFPIRNEAVARNGDLYGYVDVEEHKTIDCEGEPVVVPVKMTQTDYRDGAVLARHIVTIEPSSIQVNVDFDQDLFTLPTSNVEWVHDVDKGTHLNVGGGMPLVEESVKLSPTRVVALLLTLVVFSIAGFVVVWKKWKTRKQHA